MERLSVLLIIAALLNELGAADLQVGFAELCQGVKTFAKAFGPPVSQFVSKSWSQTWNHSEESRQRDPKVRAMEEKITMLEAELEKIKRINEVTLAELQSQRAAAQELGKVKVLNNQLPTGVFEGPWGNVAGATIRYTGFILRIDCSSFVYDHDKTVTGSILYAVTEHLDAIKGSERFQGVWDAATQTLTGHGVSVSDTSIPSLTSKLVMKFLDDHVLITHDQATTRLTKVEEGWWRHLAQK